MGREQWNSRTGFILAAVGSAIGLGNIWRFPYITYENGGGAFFIPYLFAMASAGIPFMIMEFTMGHKWRRAAPGIFTKLGVDLKLRLQWLGWFQVMIAAVIGIYYVAIIGWSISYLGLSFTQNWGDNTNDFFFTQYLQLGAYSPFNLGDLLLHIAIPMFIAWSITFFAVYTGIKEGIERANKILMPLLLIIVLFLISQTVFLPGAQKGLNYLFQPDFSQLLNVKVWSAAYGQIFFTLSVGFAIMLAYSSYLPKKSDINNNAIITVSINCGFSILAGILVFSVLGHMAEEQAQPITNVVSSGVGLAFVTIPEAISHLPIPYILGPLFFTSLVVAGLSSHISIIEAVISAIIDKLNYPRKKVATLVCGLGFIISMLFATNGGILLLDLVDYFINNIALIFSCLVEVIILAWFIKASIIRHYANQLSDFNTGKWMELCLRYMSPVILLIILVRNLINTFTQGYGDYTFMDQLLLGWGLITFMLLLSIIINICSKNNRHDDKENL
ncbi:sodium-dependent transporter [Shewanella surugensis]|uniref:Transporter n=1 Tax=Shewanella surugensis TaxID=212020 RepID=A0ABT0LCA8_9GAMM|nr:sodium-dependent transporter [Shewanella surugensis]MCL1125309.1 sodium-dependent transporter [Shewanella surugensis]